MLVDVQVHHDGTWTTVSVVGELDLAVAPRVRRAVVEAIGTGRRAPGPPAVVLDLASVHFIDSSGLGVVLGALRRVRQAAGTLRVVIAQPQVVDLFALLDLGAVVELAASVDAATATPPAAGPLTEPDAGAVSRG